MHTNPAHLTWRDIKMAKRSFRKRLPGNIQNLTEFKSNAMNLKLKTALHMSRKASVVQTECCFHE